MFAWRSSQGDLGKLQRPWARDGLMPQTFLFTPSRVLTLEYVLHHTIDFSRLCRSKHGSSMAWHCSNSTTPPWCKTSPPGLSRTLSGEQLPPACRAVFKIVLGYSSFREHDDMALTLDPVQGGHARASTEGQGCRLWPRCSVRCSPPAATTAHVPAERSRAVDGQLLRHAASHAFQRHANHRRIVCPLLSPST